MKTKTLAAAALALCLPWAGAVAAAAPEVTPALLEKGKASFTTNCVPCHGENGDGTGVAAAALNPKPRNFKTDPFKNGNTPDKVFATLTSGLPGTAMAPFAHLPEEERWAVVHYVLKTFVKPVAAPAAGKKAGKGKTK